MLFEAIYLLTLAAQSGSFLENLAKSILYLLSECSNPEGNGTLPGILTFTGQTVDNNDPLARPGSGSGSVGDTNPSEPPGDRSCYVDAPTQNLPTIEAQIWGLYIMAIFI